MYFSLTRTSRANHGYVTHTVHYIDENWKLCNHALDTSLLRWNLSDDKLVPVTSDNARNIVNAIESVNWLHFGCFIHTLQLKGSCRWLKYPKHLGVVVIWFDIFIILANQVMFKTKRFAFWRPEWCCHSLELLLYGRVYHSTSTATMSGPHWNKKNWLDANWHRDIYYGDIHWSS